jgi:glycosyltransferase involved in cell wall biosynthesis
VNQGYGGNQKLGYRYAIDHGFDIVALIHGDGQYAPEKLPVLLEPFIKGEADAVFGSRMINKQDALAGGMPFRPCPHRARPWSARRRCFAPGARLQLGCHRTICSTASSTRAT